MRVYTVMRMDCVNNSHVSSRQGMSHCIHDKSIWARQHLALDMFVLIICIIYFHMAAYHTKTNACIGKEQKACNIHDDTKGSELDSKALT